MADLWDDFDDAGEIRAPAPRAAAQPAAGSLWDDFDAPAPTVVVREPEALGPVSTVLQDNPRAVLGSRAAAADLARDRDAVARFLGRRAGPDPRAQFVRDVQTRLAPVREDLELTRVQQNAPGLFAGEVPTPTLGERAQDLGIALRQGARSLTSGVAALPVNWLNAVNRSANIGADALAGVFGQDAQDIPLLAQPEFVRYLGEQLPAQDRAELEELGSAQLQRERQELEGLGFLDTLGYVASNPTTLVDQLGAQAANIATAGVGGTVAGRLAAQGLSAASQNAQQVEAELRARFPAMSDEEIARRVADVFTTSLASEVIVPNVVPGGAAIERALAGEAGERSLRGVLGATLGEAAAGAGTEIPQQIAQNVALGDDPLEGVGQAGALGALLDAGPGAVAGLSAYGADRAAAAARTPLAPLPAPPPVLPAGDEAALVARRAEVAPVAAAGDPAARMEVARIDTALQANEAAKIAAADAQRAAQAQVADEVAAGVAAPPAPAQAVPELPPVEQLQADPRETVAALGDEPLPVVDDAVLGAFEGIEPPPAAIPNPAPAGTTAGAGAAPGAPAVGSMQPAPGSVQPAAGSMQPSAAPARSVAPQVQALVDGADDPDIGRQLGKARAAGVKVARTVADLPAEFVERMGGAEAFEGAEGVFDPQTGIAYVIEAGLGSPKATGMSRAQRKVWVAAHERTGHAGLRGAAAGRLGGTMRATLDEARANPTVQAIAAAIAGPGQGRSAEETADVDLLHEEALAELSAATQTGDWSHLEQRYGITVPQAQRNTVRGLIARLFDGIRKAFGLEGANDAAIYQLLRDANRYAESGAIPSRRALVEQRIANAEARAAQAATRAPASRAPAAEVPEDVNAPNFGAKPWPTPLADDDPLLTPTDTINTPERQQLRDRIVADHFAGLTPAPADRRPVAYVMGGGGASGKGTLLRKLTDEGVVPAENVVHIDPDAIKTGDGVTGIPEYAQLVQRGDSRAAAVVHEESSALAQRVRLRATEGRYDMVLDRTLGNPDKARRELQQLHDDGYEVRLYGITIDPATAIPRAVKRAERSGRYVPVGAMLEAHKGFAEGFEDYLPYVDEAVLYDNSGSMPVRIGALAGGQFVISDDMLYNDFARRRGINIKATTVAEILSNEQDQTSAGDAAAARGDGPRGRAAPARVPRDDRGADEGRGRRESAPDEGQDEGEVSDPLPASELETAPAGAWVRAGFSFGGREPVYQVRDVPLEKLVLPELDAAGDVAADKRRDVIDYTERAKAGGQPPNARGLELDDGRVRIQDGHRRALAARNAGRKTLRVAVSPASDPTVPAEVAPRSVAPTEYPLAPPGQRYEETDRPITWMSPDEFLAQVRPLEIDEASRDNIDDLKAHIRAGRVLDPLHIRANGQEDGRHRAVAARELGIARVPVVDERVAPRSAAPTDTAAFRRWFGDSKVVDENGDPLVVYHGTPAHRSGLGQAIEAFDRLAIVRFNNARHRLDTVGSWFSTRPDELGAGMYGDNIYPVYLSIQNPYETTFAMMARRAHMLAGTWDGYDENGERPVKGRPGVIERAAATVGQEQVDALRAWLKAMGRDGIHIVHDPRSRSTEFKAQEAWIALEPEQIKSAIANAGTFDPSDPSILRSAAPDVRTSYRADAGATTLDNIKADLRDTARDLTTLTGALRAPGQALASVNRLRSLLFDSAQSQARDLEARFPKSQALRELFDIYFEAPGYNRLVRETLPSAIESRRNVFLSRVERHLGARGLQLGKMTKAQNTQLRNALLGFREGIPDNILSAADLLRREMDTQREDALAAGVDIGEVTDIGYLTRLYDDDAILADEAGFLRDAATHMLRHEWPADVGRPRDVLHGDGTFARFIAALRRAAVDDPSLQQELTTLRDLARSYRNSSNVRGEAQQMRDIVERIYGRVGRHYAQQRAQTWLHAIRTPDISRGFNGLMESGAPVTRERSLVGAADVTLAAWMRTDVREILNAYANSIATKVEEARRVGTDPSYLKGLLDRASREGVSPEGLQDAVDILSSVTGSRVSKNATFQGFQEVASAWTYLALLGRGLFASIAEPATFAIRTGQLRHAISPLIIAGRALGGAFGFNQTNRALQRLAVDIGVNGHRAVEDTLLNNGGGDYASRFWRGVVTKFFRGIWLTQLTEAQRAYGVGASVGYLKALARQIKEGDREARIYYNELGIADHDDFADWILQQGARPEPIELFDAEGRPTPRGQDFMVATRRLVNQSIQAVQPQHRTQWQNSAGGRIFAAIMGYSQAAYTNVLRREFNLSRTLRREIGSGAQGRRAAVFLAAAGALYVNVLIISTLREALFNRARFEDKDEEDIAKELAALAASRTFGLGAVDPILQLFSNLKYKKTFAETLAGATLGTFLGDLQRVAEVFNEETNSPNTDTTEFRAMEAVYRSVVAPVANVVLSRIPIVSGVAIPAVSGANVRKWFAGLFFDTPDARTELDDQYTQATKDLSNAKRKLEQDLSTFPKEQWAQELRRLKAEFPTVLAGARLDVYAPTPSNLAAGRVGPKTDEDGKPKIVFGRRGDPNAGSLYGELEGYPQYDRRLRRWATGAGLSDQIEDVTRGIGQIRNAKDITLGQLYKAAYASGGGDKLVGDLGARIRQNPDGPEAAKLAGERLQREVLEELMQSRRLMKRAAINLSERAKGGEAIARGAADLEVARLRKGSD